MIYIIAIIGIIVGYCFGFSRGHEDGHYCEKFNNLTNKGMFDDN